MPLTPDQEENFLADPFGFHEDRGLKYFTLDQHVCTQSITN